jgi:RHS repeat-associated protein
MPRTRKSAKSNGRLVRLVLERLEDRLAPAQVAWAVDASGFWDVASNWLDDQGVSRVPAPNDDAVIDRATPITVTHRTGSDTVHSITGRDQLAVTNLSTLTVTGTVDVTGGVSLLGGTLSQAHLSAGTTVESAGGILDQTTVDGTIDLGADMPQTTARRLGVTGGMSLNGTMLLGLADGSRNGQVTFGSDQTLDGTGMIQAFGGGTFSPDQFSGATVTIGPGITVQGASASIGTDGATVVNLGTIVTSGTAPSGTANTLSLDNVVNRGTIRADAGAGLHTLGTWSNSGTIHIEGGGELFLAGSFHNAGVFEAVHSTVTLGSDFTLADLGVFHCTGGMVNLRATLDNRGTTLALDDTTGSWNLTTGGTILGGTITTAGSAQLLAQPLTAGGTLDGVTLNGTLGMTPPGSLVFVAHGLTLNGTLHTANTVRFADSSTLDGTGTVLVDGFPYNNNVGPSFGPTTGLTLHIGPHITVRGGGDFGDGFGSSGAVVTEALIDAGINGMDFPGGITVNGTGALTNDPAGTLVLDTSLLGNTTNADSFALRGRTLVPGGNGLPLAQLEVMSADLGAVPAGFTHNFAFGTLEVGTNRTLQLVDQFPNNAGTTADVLYVESLIVHSGATLDLNGLKVYARAVQIDGSVVNGTVTQLPSSGPIALGTATAGTIGVAGELDEWTFFGRQGQTVAAVVNPGNGTPTPPAPALQWAEASLLAPDGTVLADHSGTQPGQVVTLPGVSLPVDGTYRLQVRAPSGQTASTGNYLVGVWDATASDGVLQVNEQTTGHIGSPYEVDRWHFAADAGQQVRFHLQGVSDAGLAFRLAGPNGATLFNDQATDTDVLTVPASGAYTLSAYTRTGQSGDYAFTLLSSTATDLTLGTPFAGSLGGQGQFRLFHLNLAAAGPLAFDLGGATADEHLELYVRQAAPPTRADFQYSSADPQQSHQHVLLPQAAPGDWYVLVYGDPATVPGQYQLTATFGTLLIAAVTPDLSGDGTDTVLTVSGLGFTAGTSVELLGAGGTNFGGTLENFQSDLLTVGFAGHTVPPGTYSVRVIRPGGDTAQIDNAVTIVAGGAPHLEVHLDSPAYLYFHNIVSVLYVEYANTGDAAMPAPVITLHASNHALMTLDHSLVVGGFNTDQQPDGYSDTVQILAAGAAPGLLQPGASVRVPVYWAGEQLLSGRSGTIDFTLTVSTADQTDPIDWNALQTSLQPPHMSTDVWSVVFANFQSQIGSTWGDYVRMLDDNAAYLARLGESVTDARQLFGFELEQAQGLTPVRSLTSATDAAMTTPGLGLSFGRVYTNSIAAHYQTGPFGLGWYTPWQDVLQQQPDGTLYVVGPGGAERRFEPGRGAPTVGGYLSLPGDHGVLTGDGSGGFLLTEPDGTARDFRPDGKLNYVQDADGNRITAGYDTASGQLVSLTHSSGQSLTIAYNAAGLIASVTDSATPARTTTYTYDAANEHLIAVQAPDGLVTHYTYYTGAGAAREHALKTIEPPGGRVVTFTYDDQGRLASHVLNDGTERVDYGYDSPGGVTVTDATGQGELFFDYRGLLVQVRDPLGNTTQASYDEQLNLVRVTGADGLPSTFAYDTAGNIVRATDAAGNVTAFTYGPLNRLTSLTDALGHRTQFDYDPNGNLVRTIYPDRSVEQIIPDAVGDAASFTTRNGAAISYARNAAGQVLSRTLTDGTHQDYTYYPNGDLHTATDASGTTTFEYDAGDRLTRVTYPGSRFLEYFYDSAGRRKRMVDQDGFAVDYVYDAVGRLSDLTDDAGARIVHYVYDAAGRLSEEDKGNGTFTTYKYNAAGELLHLVNHAPNGSVNSQFDYTYDALGRRTTMTTLDGTWTYEYDAVGQLTHAVFASTNPAVANQDLRYEYDAVGNRTHTVINGTATDYASNNLNQYMQVGGATDGYDLDGNLTSVTDTSGTTTYTYNALDQLTGVTSAAGTWAYQYDALGNRVASTVNGQRTEYLIDPTGLRNVVGEFAGGAAVAHYTFGLGLTSRVDSGGAAYYDFDAIGSTAGLSNAAGGYADHYSYLPFGEMQTATQALANPFQFVGRFGVMQEGNGLEFMRARFYSPDAGRFTSQDPLGLAGGSVNRYDYSSNSPSNRIDPQGHYAVTVFYTPAGLTLLFPPIVAFTPLGGFIVPPGSVPLITAPPPGSAPSLAGGSLVLGGLNQLIWYPNLGGGGGAFVAFPGGGGYWVPFLPPFPGDPSAPVPGDPCPCGPGPAGAGPGSPSPYNPPEPTPAPEPPAVPPGPDQPPEPEPTPTPRSVDPNSKTGPAGVGAANFVRGDAVLPYRIDFENDAHATAPAQHVDVTDQLSHSLDWSTLEFTEVGFGSTLVAVPTGSHYFRTALPVTENGKDFQVDIELKFDPNTGLLTGTFDSLDPVTGLPPDVLTGFLPPEDGSGRGMGHVSYIVKPRAGLPSGTAFRNVALVRFDFQETVATDQVDDHDPSKGTDPAKEALATIDSVPPTSSVSPLPAFTGSTSFTVSWSGLDDAGGSGVASYDIYVSDNGGPWQLWQDHASQTSAVYPGQPGHSYAFYSVAFDNVGNQEGKTPAMEAQTQTPLVQTALTQATGNLAPPASKIATLLGSHYHDADKTTKPGIAVTALSGNGNWQYLKGRTWISITAVSDANALLLPASDQLRFQPAGLWTGEADLFYVAWDGSQGSAGGHADVHTRGGGTPFSTAAGMLAVTLTPTVHAPTWLAKRTTLAPVLPGDNNPAGQTVQQAFAGLYSADGSQLPAIAVVGLTPGTPPGAWQYQLAAGGTWQSFPKVSTSAALLLGAQDMLRFVPAGNFTGSVAIFVHAWDGTGSDGGTVNLSKRGSTGGKTAFSSAILTATLHVNNAPTQNPPTGGITLPAISENVTSKPVSVATLLKDAQAADADKGTALGLAITAATGPGTWQFQVGRGTWQAVPSTATLLLPPNAMLRFRPAADQSGTASLTWSAWDLTQGTSGGTFDITVSGGASAFSAAGATATLIVTSSQQPPAWSGSGAALTPVLPNTTNPPGDTVASIFGAYYQPGANVGIAVTALTGTANGTWQYSRDGGQNWINFPAVSTQKARLLSAGDRLRFVPKTGFLGTAALVAYAWDGSTGSDGSTAAIHGSAFSSSTLTAVCLTNTAPTLVS